MHKFGEWFDEHSPDEEPIHGFLYRGWNQADETAGPRAADHLPEWQAAVDESVASGGNIFSAGGH